MISDSDPDDVEDKPQCKYGAQCYRKNKQHVEKFEHPPKIEEDKPLPAAKRQKTDSISLKQQKLSCFFSKNAPKKVLNEPSSSEKKAEEEESSIPHPVESTSNIESSCFISKNAPKKVPNEPSSSEKRAEEEELFIPDPVESTSNIESTSASTSMETCFSESLTNNDETHREIIKKLFLVSMPDDFYSLWKFCCTLSPKNPCNALKSINLQLVGPYDVLNGNMKGDIENSQACRHWRYFFDPPEFQTILKCDDESELLHFGYYRDDPNELPVLVGFNKAAKDAIITPAGENVFAAINWYINHTQEKSNPFQKTQLASIKNELHKWAKTYEYSLSTYTEKMRKRDKIVVAKTFHRAGIVVPYNKETELGYRPLSKTPTELVKLLQKIENSETDEQRTINMSELHEVITWANIAVDEGDYGTTLELGIDLFCFRSKYFNRTILQLLTSVYKLLNRDAFATILKAHMDDRKEGSDLSVFKK